MGVGFGMWGGMGEQSSQPPSNPYANINGLVNGGKPITQQGADQNLSQSSGVPPVTSSALTATQPAQQPQQSSGTNVSFTTPGGLSQQQPAQQQQQPYQQQQPGGEQPDLFNHPMFQSWLQNYFGRYSQPLGDIEGGGVPNTQSGGGKISF